MNRNRLTVASSNRYAPDSFLGKNFPFRPYFTESMAGRPYMYLALGTTSHKRGACYSQPVYSYSGLKSIGVSVIKASIEPIESRLITDDRAGFYCFPCTVVSESVSGSGFVFPSEAARDSVYL